MSDFVSGNRIDLLRAGAEYFPALEAACDAACDEIYLETYIFEDDAAGQRIAAALSRAARRGVIVHVMIDGFGSKDLGDDFLRAMLDAGVRVLTYRPQISPWTLRRERLRRLHRKIVVIDARVAFVGGINIIDDMHTPKHVPPRFDYAVRVEGPLLAVIHPVVGALVDAGHVDAVSPALGDEFNRGADAAPAARGAPRFSFAITCGTATISRARISTRSRAPAPKW